ncbi:MAG: hypothetical protein ACI97B_001562 [Verrucomicrobiales bacterium]|jgi:hypothetical protein
MRKNHQGWRVRNEDGEVREYMGVRELEGWRIQSRLKNEEEWERHDRPEQVEVEQLIHHLDLKYRRTKGSYKEVEMARKLLKIARPTKPPEPLPNEPLPNEPLPNEPLPTE